VLAASIRDVAKVTLAFWNGAHICTIPPKVFNKMYDHVLTDAGLKIFDEDHKTTFSSTDERVGGDLDAIDGMEYNFVDDGFTYTIDTPETQGLVDFGDIDTGTGFIP